MEERGLGGGCGPPRSLWVMLLGLRLLLSSSPFFRWRCFLLSLCGMEGGERSTPPRGKRVGERVSSNLQGRPPHVADRREGRRPPEERGQAAAAYRREGDGAKGERKKEGHHPRLQQEEKEGHHHSTQHQKWKTTTKEREREKDGHHTKTPTSEKKANMEIGTYGDLGNSKFQVLSSEFSDLNQFIIFETYETTF